jgi:hypothetical protein
MPGMSTLMPGQAHAAATVDPFDRDRFLFAQKLFSIHQTYHVFDESNRPILFVQRSSHWARRILAILGFVATVVLITAGAVGLAVLVTSDLAQLIIMISGAVLGIAAGVSAAIWIMPKRHIEFYADESRQRLLLRIYQDQKWAWLVSTFTAADADDNLLGWYSKNVLTDIFRKRWKMFDPEGRLVCLGMEDSWVNAVLRRVFREYWPMRLNFIYVEPESGRKLGEFNRKFTLLDKYVLDLSADAGRTLNRCLALGMGVLFDTGEKR